MTEKFYDEFCEDEKNIIDVSGDEEVISWLFSHLNSQKYWSMEEEGDYYVLTNDCDPMVAFRMKNRK